MYQPPTEPRRRRSHPLFPKRTSSQSLRSQYSRSVQLVQLIEDFRRQEADLYDPVPPTPPPRAPGRQRSGQSMIQPLVRFASPFESLAPRRRPKTPMSAPVMVDIPLEQEQAVFLAPAVLGEGEEKAEEAGQRRRLPPQGPSPLSNYDEFIDDDQSLDLSGFLTPPGFVDRGYLTPIQEADDWLDLEDAAGKVYVFDPSRSAAGPSKDDDDAFDLESLLSDESALKGEDPPPGRAFHVYQSRYTGRGVLGGPHSATLEIVYDLRRQQQSLFRWLHVQQDMMNFDEFTNEVSRSISEAEQDDIRKLLSEVRDKFAKTIRTSGQTTVKHMESSFLELPIRNDGPEKASKLRKRSVTWLCIPYFSLEAYSGIQAAENPGAYPPQPLLQASFSRNTQKRDMLQATRQIGNGEKDWCFHIRQLWCIVLDNSLLITCGSMSEATLRGDTVNMVSEPARDPTSGADAGRILIQYGESVLWSFPLEECQTWFAFVAHFSDFWPTSMCFYFNSHLLTEASWWKVLQFSRTSRKTVVVTMEPCTPPQLPPSGILRPITPDMGQVSRCQPGASIESWSLSKTKRTTFSSEHLKTNSEFHAFGWAETHPSNLIDGPNFVVLQKQLSEVEAFLTADTNGPDQRVYMEAESSTRMAVHTYLEQQGAALRGSMDKPLKMQDYEDRVDIFNAADSLFSFFLPSLFDGPTTDKFWGAVMNLVWMPLSETATAEPHAHALDNRRRSTVYANVPIVRKALRQLALPVTAFRSILSHAGPKDRTEINVPLDLIRTWLHLVMGLVYASQDTKEWADHVEAAHSLLESGTNHVMERLSKIHLLERSSVLPLEVVSLFSSNLLSKTSGTYAGISATYSEYLKLLENDIANGVSHVAYQQQINFLRQEMDVINRTIAAQGNVLGSILTFRRPDRSLATAGSKHHRMGRTPINEQGGGRTKHFESASPWSHLRPARNIHADDDDADDSQFLLEPVADVLGYYKLPTTDAAGFRDLLAAECTQLSERRARRFDEYSEQVDILEQTNLKNAAAMKGRQEQAIYAFTIVTIIFLPLSAISSIFGMNTRDIRDMEAGQGLYWAAAIPVTIIVVILSLWRMGELEKLLDRVASKLHGDNGYGPRFPSQADVIEKPSHYEAATILPAPTGVYTRSISAKQSFTRLESRPGS